MSEAEIRTATPGDAGVVGRLLWDFNTEFETPTPSAEEFTIRFARLLTRDEVLVLLAGGAEPTGFAYLTLRPTPYFDGPPAQRGRHRHPALLRTSRVPQHPARHRLPDAVLRAGPLRSAGRPDDARRA
jgi:hypothetical protein